jgi:hypothetical protein
MSVQERSEVRELTAAELDEVAGGGGYADADGGYGVGGGGGGGGANLGDVAVAVVKGIIGAVGRWF